VKNRLLRFSKQVNLSEDKKLSEDELEKIKEYKERVIEIRETHTGLEDKVNELTSQLYDCKQVIAKVKNDINPDTL